MKQYWFYQLAVNSKRMIRNTFPQRVLKGKFLRDVYSFFSKAFSCFQNRSLKKRLRIYLNEKSGLEIGGPTKMFEDRDVLPIYTMISHLDGCNLSTMTPWQGKIDPGLTYAYHPDKPKGRQYICDAVDLTSIDSGAYDFVLASHVLEHIANPLKALSEWLRVLKKEGVLLVILPDQRETFDCKRPCTTLSHLIDDFNRSISEDDQTHIPEILATHDVIRDPSVKDEEDFKERTFENLRFRYLHQHIFNEKLLRELFAYLRQELLTVDLVLPFHIVSIVKKVKDP